jgi:hypothetical protein
LPRRWAQIKLSWHDPLFWVVFLLIFVNYGLEARKWQLLIRPLEKFTLLKAFKSVLAGCSIVMITPNRMGEFGGRILFVSPSNRIRATFLTFLGSVSQLLVTFLAGTIGIIILRLSSWPGIWDLKFIPLVIANTLMATSICISVLLLLFYMRIAWLIRVLEKMPLLAKPLKYLLLLEQFSDKQLLRILFLSFIRYVAFILQYVLLLQVMQVGVGYMMCFWLLTIFYLLMAVAPTIGFTEFPLRAMATVYIFKLYSTNIVGIQAAALGIWLMNLFLPALLGTFLILGLKISGKNE